MFVDIFALWVEPSLKPDSVARVGKELVWALHQHRIPVVDLRAFGELMSTIVSTFHAEYEAIRSTAV